MPEIAAATSAQKKRIEEVFTSRLEQVHGIDPRDSKRKQSRKAMELQVEFFAGAMAALNILTGEAPPAGWVIMLASGRSVV